jgi:hypothetical protein
VSIFHRGNLRMFLSLYRMFAGLRFGVSVCFAPIRRCCAMHRRTQSRPLSHCVGNAVLQVRRPESFSFPIFSIITSFDCLFMQCVDDASQKIHFHECGRSLFASVRFNRKMRLQLCWCWLNLLCPGSLLFALLGLNYVASQ